MNNNSKGIVQIIIPIILALIVFAGIGYYALKNGQIRPAPTLSPTPTANLSREELKDWKTYTNSEYSYSSVKYPPDWKFEYVNDPPTLSAIRFVKPGGETIFEKVVDIIVEPNPRKDIPNINWYKKWVSQIPAGVNLDALLFEEVSFQGLPALKVIVKNVGYETIFFAKETYMYRLGWYFVGYDIPDSETVGKWKETFNQILSTFRFLDREQNIETEKKVELFMSGIFIQPYDRIYFHTIVLKDKSLKPETIEIFNGGSKIAGPFLLVKKSNFGYCEHLSWTGGVFYETEGIRLSELPKDIWNTNNDYTYKVQSQNLDTNDAITLNISEPPGICESIAD